jgi:hypothetical protein
MRLGEQDAHTLHVRRRWRRRSKKIALLVLIFFVLFSIIGFVYTWYAGQQEVEPALDISTIPSKQPQRDLAEPTKDSQVGVSVQSFTAQAQQGDNVTLVIKTLRGAACSILFTYNDDNERSDDTGLIPKIADDYGYVDWTWTVGQGVQDGTWPVEVVCANGSKHAYSRSDLAVKR